jgi:hypothetical protein
MQSDRSLIDLSRASKLTTGFGAPVREGDYADSIYGTGQGAIVSGRVLVVYGKFVF